jgi:hypothetical protein
MFDIPLITFVFDTRCDRLDNADVVFNFFDQQQTGIGGNIASVEGCKDGFVLNRGEFDCG